MPSSYNAPYSFAKSPGFGSGWTNLSEYLTQANMNAVSGLEEEPLFDPGNPGTNWPTPQSAEFDAWLFRNKYPTRDLGVDPGFIEEPEEPPAASVPPTGVTINEDRRRRGGGGGARGIPGGGPIRML